MRLELDQFDGGQLLQRLAHRRAADAEFTGDLFFAEPGAGGEMPVEDCLAQRLTDHIGGAFEVNELLAIFGKSCAAMLLCNRHLRFLRFPSPCVAMWRTTITVHICDGHERQYTNDLRTQG